jgi:hypothetical protein
VLCCSFKVCRGSGDVIVVRIWVRWNCFVLIWLNISQCWCILLRTELVMLSFREVLFNECCRITQAYIWWVHVGRHSHNGQTHPFANVICTFATGKGNFCVRCTSIYRPTNSCTLLRGSFEPSVNTLFNCFLEWLRAVIDGYFMHLIFTLLFCDGIRNYEWSMKYHPDKTCVCIKIWIFICTIL